MTLLLSEADVQGLFSMDECIAALEDGYRDLVSGDGQNIPRGRIRFAAKNEGEASYLFNCIPGGSRRLGVCAVRLDSEARYAEKLSERAHSGPTRDHRHSGLIFLYSTESGELIAILPDYTVSGMRVGATSALATKYMARDDACNVAIFGSGKQARANLAGICAVRKIRSVKVYSPNVEHRIAFAEQMTEVLDVEIAPASTPAETMAGADIVIAATNAVNPVFDGTTLKPGTHIVSIVGSDKFASEMHGVPRREIDETTLKRADVIVVHLLDQIRIDQQGDIYRLLETGSLSWDRLSELPQVISGEVPGRQSAEQITFFYNNTGTGIQFAAAGKHIFDRAKALGRGREIPTDWFTTDTSSYARKGFYSSP
jgi:ornithine cyclodeaminase/alanine dehydrogenase-like protein (mu-crystallin family)